MSMRAERRAAPTGGPRQESPARAVTVKTDGWELARPEMNRISTTGTNGGATKVQAVMRLAAWPQTGVATLHIDLSADGVKRGSAGALAQLESVTLYKVPQGPGEKFVKVGEGLKAVHGFPQLSNDHPSIDVMNNWAAECQIQGLAGRVKPGEQYVAVVTVKMNGSKNSLQLRTEPVAGPRGLAQVAAPNHVDTASQTMSRTDFERIPEVGSQNGATEITPSLKVYRGATRFGGRKNAHLNVTAKGVRLEPGTRDADARVSSAVLYRVPNNTGAMEKVGELVSPGSSVTERDLTYSEDGRPPALWQERIDLGDQAFRTKPGEKYFAVITAHMNGDRGPGVQIRTPVVKGVADDHNP